MWLLHVKTCPNLHVQGLAWCSDVRYWVDNLLNVLCVCLCVCVCVCVCVCIQGLSKKYLTLNFPAHSIDARAAPLCTVEGDSLMCMPELFLCIRVCQLLPSEHQVKCYRRTEREKFYPGPGLERGTLAFRANALTN